MERYVISLGTNLGDRMAQLRTAKRHIAEEIGDLAGQSSVYETAAWGNENQAPFYNQLVQGYTGLTALKLMDVLLGIEAKMGRERSLKWSPRTIDLDIIFFGSDIIDEEELRVPHPMFHLRRFTLVPLVEMMPDFIDPRSGKKMETLLIELNDNLAVNKLV